MSEDEELAALRKRRSSEMQRQLGDSQNKAAQRQQIEAQKAQALRGILSTEARDRLNNLKLARPELADQIENQLTMLAQSGRIKGLLSDNDLKQILTQMMSQKRETKIEFR